MSCGPVSRSQSAQAGGFTVLEALIGLAILAGALVLAQMAYATGWSAVRRTGLEGRAVAVAKARLAMVGTDAGLQALETTGTEDGFSWRLVIARHAPTGSSPETERLAAWWITVEVEWRELRSARSRSVRLATVKLGPPAP